MRRSCPQDDRERVFSGSRRRCIESGEAGIQMNKRFVGVLTFAFLVAAGASLVLYRVLINRPATAKAGSRAGASCAGDQGSRSRHRSERGRRQGGRMAGRRPGGRHHPGQRHHRPRRDHGHLRQGADHRIAPGAQGRRRRNGRHDSAGNARRGRPRQRSGGRRRLRCARHARGHPDLRQHARRQRDPGHAHANSAAEHRSALRRPGFQEGRGRQAGHGAGGQSAGDPDAGRATQPGRQPDQHSTGAAQSVGSRDRQDSRDRAPASLHQWKAAAAASIGNVTAPPRQRAPRAAPLPVRAVAPPPRPRRSPS